MLTVVLTISSTVQQAAGILTQLFGLAALAGVLGGGLAVGYRWYTGSRVPQWLAILVGTAGVALYLGTTAALEEVIRSDIQPTEVEIVLFNLTALLAGGGGGASCRAVSRGDSVSRSAGGPGGAAACGAVSEALSGAGSARSGKGAAGAETRRSARQPLTWPSRASATR